MLVWIISYESLNLSQPNPVWWYMIISQSVMCEKWIAIFKVKVTVTEFGFIKWNHDYFYYIFWTADFLATNLVWQCMFISWSVLWKGCFTVFKVKVTVKILNFNEYFPGEYLWSITFSKVMHHHQPEYHSEISSRYVQNQSHNRFYKIFRNTETFATQISLIVHHHKTG